MWAQACQLIDEAEQMHRQFFRLGVSERTEAVWEPPVDVFEDDSEIVVVVALPGVAAEAVEVTIEPGAMHVRAQARFAFAGPHHVVRRLEIPYGNFERRIPLPLARLEAGTRESTNGCLVLRLRKLTGGPKS
jgi:HSP20 family molecular chaperone IbpA